ncbi:hypothetical protein TVAGG3_0070690, partial [Trichomonas vaginalis G3]|uniref:hypothetical protein n=1 Tax=Trichomonas vaginalis (strain ATCC PRA-98 / G3) TaxID=412133 RepID=UPI0021E5C2C0
MTLKLLMNSTWGYSIKKPQEMKSKHYEKVDNFVERFSPFVLKYEFTQGQSGLVTTLKPIVEHWSYPQFAKAVLDNYNKFFSEVKSKVKVYYENIDALMTNEEGTTNSLKWVWSVKRWVDSNWTKFSPKFMSSPSVSIGAYLKTAQNKTLHEI